MPRSDAPWTTYASMLSYVPSLLLLRAVISCASLVRSHWAAGSREPARMTRQRRKAKARRARRSREVLSASHRTQRVPLRAVLARSAGVAVAVHARTERIAAIADTVWTAPASLATLLTTIIARQVCAHCVALMSSPAATAQGASTEQGVSRRVKCAQSFAASRATPVAGREIVLRTWNCSAWAVDVCDCSGRSAIRG
jgi:hypothetical protein